MTSENRTHAFEGGQPAFDREEIAAVWPCYDDSEEEALRRVLRSGRWCRLKDDHWEEGETGLFESAFRSYLQGGPFLACANGTMAIELALRALDISVGDEVIVQAGTFFGTVTPVLRLGAVPVFVDLDETSYGVDPDEVDRAVTPRTRAVIAVHLSGLCADMDALESVCTRHGLPLIEDCAQSVGSRWRGRALGTFGDLACFSFQQDKPLQAGEGGGVMCRDERIFGRLYALHQGFSVHGAPRFERHEVGTNLRITPWQGAVLRCQLQRLDEQIARRRSNADLLDSLLGDNSPLEPVAPLAEMTVWSIFSRPFRYRPEFMAGMPRDQFLALLRAEGLPGFEGHVEPLYLRPLFRDNKLNYVDRGCGRTEQIARDAYLSLMQWFFLGPPEWMHRFADLVGRVQDAAPKLISDPVTPSARAVLPAADEHRLAVRGT
jgi:dTDP-4-amino-4,6-dideoxygalactose transaminase